MYCAGGAWVRLVLEERASEVDVVESVGDGPLRLVVHVGLHTRHAVVRHLLREVLWENNWLANTLCYGNMLSNNLQQYLRRKVHPW